MNGPAYLWDMRALLCFIVVAALLNPVISGGGSRAWAQDEKQEEEQEQVAEPRAQVVSLLGGEVEVERPTGWIIVPAGPGAMATLRSASDEVAQIEIRSSDGVSSSRWDHFKQTFENELQRSGFVVSEAQAEARFGALAGPLREYELQQEDSAYRLVTWHVHVGDRAWVFAAFYRAQRQEIHRRTFEELLSGLRWAP